MIGATKRSPQPFPGQRPIAEFNKMKFLAIESLPGALRISLKLNISAAREQQAVGLGLFNVVASWVMACEYLSLGLHVGNHSRPTPLTIIFYFC